MKNRILFVDDEENILRGYRRLLRGFRDECEISLAASGDEALNILSEGVFDVIVTDMRMPGMDGNQLLAEVKELYPHVVRIILSGHADMEANLKSVKFAHRYLSKPCSGEELKEAIVRSSKLCRALGNAKVMAVVNSIENLPSLPTLYTEVVNELESPDGSLQMVGTIISKDISMTTKLLQIVNSAFFGLSQHMGSPEMAATYLGIDNLKALVLATGVFSNFDQSDISLLSVDDICSHGMLVGACARAIAKEEGCDKKTVDDSMLAGMLHDLGRLILATYFSDEYNKAMELVRDNGYSLCDAEKEVLGTTHGIVGSYLLDLWGLSESIVEAVAFHHQPELLENKGFSPLLAVYMAEMLISEIYGNNDNGSIIPINNECLAGNDLAGRVEKWRSICKEIKERGN